MFCSSWCSFSIALGVLSYCKQAINFQIYFSNNIILLATGSHLYYWNRGYLLFTVYLRSLVQFLSKPHFHPPNRPIPYYYYMWTVWQSNPTLKWAQENPFGYHWDAVNYKFTKDPSPCFQQKICKAQASDWQPWYWTDDSI